MCVWKGYILGSQCVWGCLHMMRVCVHLGDWHVMGTPCACERFLCTWASLSGLRDTCAMWVWEGSARTVDCMCFGGGSLQGASPKVPSVGVRKGCLPELPAPSTLPGPAWYPQSALGTPGLSGEAAREFCFSISTAPMQRTLQLREVPPALPIFWGRKLRPREAWPHRSHCQARLLPRAGEGPLWASQPLGHPQCPPHLGLHLRRLPREETAQGPGWGGGGSPAAGVRATGALKRGEGGSRLSKGLFLSPVTRCLGSR